MKNAEWRVGAVILAAGKGSRMGADVTKQKMNISGVSVIKRAVLAFMESRLVTKLVVVCRADELDFVASELSELRGKPIGYAVGGKTRRESAKIGFMALGGDFDFVAIHDAARPLIKPEGINEVCRAAFLHGAASASSPVSDTVKVVSGGFAVATEDRERLATVQTPQVFRRELYLEAISSVGEDIPVTDDNMLIEALGGKVALVDIGKYNIKITTGEDIAFAEFLINGGWLDG